MISDMTPPEDSAKLQIHALPVEIQHREFVLDDGLWYVDLRAINGVRHEDNNFRVRIPADMNYSAPLLILTNLKRDILMQIIRAGVLAAEMNGMLGPDSLEMYHDTP